MSEIVGVMLLRRLSLAVPLALLVAVLMHVALFGTRHAPGAEHANQLLAGLGAGLTLAALCCVLLAALFRRRGQRERRRFRFVSPLELAAGGAVAYALIELSEGHTPLGDSSWQIAALLAAAFAVSGMSSLIARVLRRSGEALAAFAADVAVFTSPLVVTLGRRSLCARSAAVAPRCRGRAPPLFS